MLSDIKQRLGRDEEGFTLIELMVVLLIIAILLAIAIPTFLGARNTANARSTQENLRNALTAEQTNWTSNQTFAPNLSSVEPSLSWTTATLAAAGGNKIDVAVYTTAVSGSPAALTATADTSGTGTNDDGVQIAGYGKDNNCYAIFQSNNASLDFTAYAKYAPGTGGCALNSTPTAAPTTGSAANGTAGTWYTSF